MMNIPAVTARTSALAAPALLFSLLQQAPPAPPSTAASIVYQGTVQAVQRNTASFDLITGVGFALRLVRIRTAPETQFTGDGATFAFTDIEPGVIVRAECRMTDAGPVADRITKVILVGSQSGGQR
ncbi:MAG: hypothetical protein ACREMF_04580 [Gemmatimonadales bacterium]